MKPQLELLLKALNNSTYYRLNQIDVTFDDENIYVTDKNDSESRNDVFYSTGVIVLVEAFNVSNYIKLVEGRVTLIIY
tara:strand:- start:45 stop:278 length:234 start_codon:yes stop_codon:yes gene_type:complete